MTLDRDKLPQEHASDKHRAPIAGSGPTHVVLAAELTLRNVIACLTSVHFRGPMCVSCSEGSNKVTWEQQV
jgi:hypothetical protein